MIIVKPSGYIWQNSTVYGNNSIPNVSWKKKKKMEKNMRKELCHFVNKQVKLDERKVKVSLYTKKTCLIHIKSSTLLLLKNKC